MFEANAEWVSLAGICGTLFGFGLWPRLRQRCEAPVAVFAPLNMLTQFAVIWVFALLLGSPLFGSEHAWWQRAAAIQWGPRAYALVVGGFILGHGDNLGCIAFEFIPTAVAYPTYSGISLAGGELLNYAIVGSKTPVWLFSGLGCLMLGICLLAAAQEVLRTAPETQDRPTWVRNSTDVTRQSDEWDGDPLSEDASTAPTTDLGVALIDAAEDASVQAPPKVSAPPLDQRQAFLLCVATGILGALWSPLSTFGRRGAAGVHDPYVGAALFQGGQALAVPSVCYWASRLTRSGVRGPWRRATARTARRGALCGVSVGVGYCGYFYATTLGRLEPTVALGIAASNPLVVILIDVFVERSFARAPRKARACLAASVVSYVLAITILAGKTK